MTEPIEVLREYLRIAKWDPRLAFLFLANQPGDLMWETFQLYKRGEL